MSGAIVRSRSARVVSLGVLVALVGAACSSGSDGGGEGDEAGATAVADEPVYAEPGPYPVGVTTLDLGDRLVEVYYPAEEGSEEGVETATYEQDDPIPEEVAAGLPPIPEDVDLTFEYPAYRDLPIAGDGPFPVLLFGHGAGGWRMVQSTVLAGVASWGIVVASTDHVEHGLLSFLGLVEDEEVDSGAVALETLAALEEENTAEGGRFEGTIDTDRVGAGGHSAGGGTAFSLLDVPEIDVIIGWAPGGPDPGVSSETPTMVIAAEGDIAVTPEEVEGIYDDLDPPKRLVIIDGAGHNSFTDACLVIAQGSDLIQIARDLGLPIPDRLLDLGENGCQPDDLPPEDAFRVIQHFTVAQLRHAFGIDAEPVGLGDGVASAFPGITMDYRQEG